MRLDKHVFSKTYNIWWRCGTRCEHASHHLAFEALLLCRLQLQIIEIFLRENGKFVESMSSATAECGSQGKFARGWNVIAAARFVSGRTMMVAILHNTTGCFNTLMLSENIGSYMSIHFRCGPRRITGWDLESSATSTRLFTSFSSK